MTERLRDAAFELAVRLREGQENVQRELAELELALAAAAIESELLLDLPRRLELCRNSAPQTDFDQGYNFAMEEAASLVRFVVNGGQGK